MLSIRLILPLIEVLGSKFYLVFNINSNVIKEELCNIIRSQWQSYQLEKIPEEFYTQEDAFKTQNNAQFSYWKQAYELCELNEPHKEQSTKDLICTGTEFPN